MYDEGDFQEAEHSINLPVENNCVYQDYFSYSAGVLELESPQNWREALTMYERLIEVA